MTWGGRRIVLTMLAATVVQLHAIAGRAQSTTADGIEAFVRGDYPRAAEILKPIAERWPGEVDDAALFFMGAMYGNGLGLPQNIERSCALYERSGGAIQPGMFARLNLAIFQGLHATLTVDQAANCQMLATIGFDHRFEPATFTLEPGHWITLDLSSRTQSVSATISYQGREKQSNLPVALSPGMVFLPIEHTELQVGDAVPERRHFIEVFTWLPDASSSQWSLAWSLSEVVREDPVPVATDILLTAPGSAPPDRSSVDPRSLVSVRVNTAGKAEWAILSGANARRETIETDAERQEVRLTEQARKSAEERVDWKRVRDPDRPPSFTYADANGCSDLFVYGWSDDRAEVIAIRIDQALLQQSATPRTFDLARHQNEIELTVDVFQHPQRAWPFCTDVQIINEGNRKQTWRAVGGTVTVQLSPPGIRAQRPELYRATIQIDGAEFVSPAGVRVRPSHPIRVTAVAGGFLGG